MNRRRVFVYWNLQRGLWSVKDITPGSETYGRVIVRMPEILLENAEGKVSEAGRQRVLREKRKNVHAGIVGSWPAGLLRHNLAQHVEDIGDRITYNPYKYARFVHVVDESPFEGSHYALLTLDRAVYVA